MPTLLAAWARHEGELRRWLAARWPLASEVDDLLQEVFLKAWRHADGFERIAQPRAWFYEVARNTLTDRLRTLRTHEPLPVDVDAVPEPDAAVDPVDLLAQTCLPRVLAELDPQDRQAIELCDLQGISQRELAERLGLSLPAAKSRVQRARQRLRARMVAACQVVLDAEGHVQDFVPRDTRASDGRC